MSKNTALGIVVDLFNAETEHGPRRATTADLGRTSVEMSIAKREGLVAERGSVKTGKRGRPPVIWGLTDKGRGRAKRAAAQS